MEQELVTITVEVDSKLLVEVQKVLDPLCLTVERAFEMFIHWLVKYPEEAVPQLLKWKEEQEQAEEKEKRLMCQTP